MGVRGSPAGALDPGVVRARVAAVRERIAAACRRAGRDPQEVRVVAVVKGFGPEVAAAAVQAGLQDLGENRVQEARAKIPAVRSLLGGAAAPAWHLVGHLQRNKAKWAVELFDWVHSVDSAPLAHELSRRATSARRTVRVLVEVNVAGEPTKHGVEPREAQDLVELVASLPGLRLEGLMTVAPLSPDPEGVRWVFRALRELRDRIRTDRGLELRELSMGMTDDFEVAVEEGATWLRLGRALLGERPTAQAERVRSIREDVPGPQTGTTPQRG